MSDGTPSSGPAPRTVILTGASRGIGHATLKRFSREGWRLITCSREAAPEACQADPNWVTHIPTDLSEPDDVAAFIDRALAALDGAPAHALINNAAVSPKTAFKERLGCLNGDIDQWRRVFELNFFTPLTLSRGFARALAKGAKDLSWSEEKAIDRPSAAIVNITSIAGHAIHPFAGSAYSTSKAGLSALTREMAVEFAQLGVRVNAVAPGEIETEMISPDYEPLVNRIPLGRMGAPDEVAAVVYQLSTGDFSYVTGAEIFLTGGQHVY
ncbi:MAG: SDR family oxidoreductase [Alphaproteobacteria bacterium]|nr:SDR family oxidoreductase [Alphaproteobacteria bacterium]